VKIPTHEEIEARRAMFADQIGKTCNTGVPVPRSEERPKLPTASGRIPWLEQPQGTELLFSEERLSNNPKH
jgi:hypothetical protein